MRILIFLAAVALMALVAPSSRAQFQQPLVFSSAGAVAVRNDQTGALTPVGGSPFSPSTQTAFAIDVQGRFLFSLGANSIHMFQITNSTTGAYSEVCGSPFASPNTNQPLFIAVEPTGQFLAVVNLIGQNPGAASLETFTITPSATVLCPSSAIGPALIPVSGSAVELDSTPVGIAQPPNNKNFLIFMGPNPNSPNSTLLQGSEFQALSIDPQTGLITGIQQDNATAERGLSFAMDPQGRYYAMGTTDHLHETGNIQIVGLDGKITSDNVTLPVSDDPVGLWIDSTGSFLYAAVSNPSNLPVVQIYSLNFQTSQLTQTSSSPLPNFTSVPPYAPDPTGAFDYGFGTDENTVIAYSVDPLTGYFVATAISPFTIPQIGGSLTFSIPPGQQGVSAPSASLSASTLSFGSLQTGASSMPQVITLTSNGGEALSVDSIALSGADPSQFIESDTCQAPSVLQPNKFCSISITFGPTATGLQQATLMITDNAPNSPQSVQLNGTGVAPPPPAPAVSIAPNPLNFPTIPQGTTSGPTSIIVTNSGNATLHIASAMLAGNNPSDFSMISNCSGAYAPNATCSISLSFTPLAAGQRSATVTLSDDAQNSPQVIQITGSATSSPPTTPLVSLSSSTLSFAPITQGTVSASQTVTVANSGGATLHISSVALGGVSPSDFSLTNGCTAAAYGVNSNCILTISFSPLSPGVRAASITIADDAPNSPQTITVSGIANAAVTAGPAPNGSVSATVTAGQSAQFNLLLTPGPGYSGTVSLSCTGAPLGAACSLPPSLQLSSGAAAAFTVMVTTSGASTLPPISELPHSWPVIAPRLPPIPAFALAMFFLLVWCARPNALFALKRLRYASALCLAAMALCSASGCGGGSPAMMQPPPPPIVTPQGTSTIVVTPAASSASGKPLQLQPIQLTLTVN